MIQNEDSANHNRPLVPIGYMCISCLSDNDNLAEDTIDVTTSLGETLVDASASHPEEIAPEAEPQSLDPELETHALCATAAEETVPELDAELLIALGDTPDEVPTYGEKIHQNLAQRWQPILSRGLLKEPKDKLLKEYAVPENCKLLRAPSLNPEISAALTEPVKARDKKIETAQQQLGLGLTAINRAMTILLNNGEDKQSRVQAIKMFSDGTRILSDLHYTETQYRSKLITPCLDKAFLNIIQNVERDEFLFGNKLSEKIKASKTIEKQGLQIKRGTVTPKAPTPSTSYPSTQPRYQGNWTAPSRYQQSKNRGGRGGVRKTPATTSSHKTAPPAQQQARPSTYTKPRAPPRQ